MLSKIPNGNYSYKENPKEDIFFLNDIRKNTNERKKEIRTASPEIKEKSQSHEKKKYYNKFDREFNFEKMSYMPLDYGSELNKIAQLSRTPNAILLQKVIEEREMEKRRLIEYKKKISLKKKKNAITVSRKSIHDLIKKTRDIAMLRYSAQIQANRANVITETYDNELNNINDSLTTLKKAKSLYVDQYSKKYDQYLKTILLQKEEELSEMTLLKEKKYKLEGDIQATAKALIKLETEKEKYDKWRKLFNLIKENKRYLSSFNNDILYHCTSKQVSNSNSNIYLTSDLLHQNIKSGVLLLTELQDKDTTLLYKSSNIFSSPEEIFNELAKKENENIQMLDVFNEKTVAIAEERTILKKLKEEDEKRYNRLSLLIQEKEKKLLSAKNINKELMKKAKIISQIQSHTLTPNNHDKHLQQNLFDKISILFNTSKELELPNEMNCENMKVKVEFNCTYSMLNMLRFIERRIEFIIEKFKYYRRPDNLEKYTIPYNEVMTAIEKDHKRQNFMKSIKLQAIRRALMKKKIEEKSKKVIIRSNRKVAQSYKLHKKVDKSEKHLENQNIEPGFEDYMNDIL